MRSGPSQVIRLDEAWFVSVLREDIGEAVRFEAVANDQRAGWRIHAGQERIHRLVRERSGGVVLRADQGVSTHRVKCRQVGAIRDGVVLQWSRFQREDHKMTWNALFSRDIDEVRPVAMAMRKSYPVVRGQQVRLAHTRRMVQIRVPRKS